MLYNIIDSIKKTWALPGPRATCDPRTVWYGPRTVWLTQTGPSKANWNYKVDIFCAWTKTALLLFEVAFCD